MIIYSIVSSNYEQTLSLADLFVKEHLLPNLSSDNPSVVYLIGDLGAGKTTFIRGVLASVGFSGSVKSPTYTIVETYNDLKIPIYHFDLYRLEQACDLELIGIRDYLNERSILFFEWPEQGIGHIPAPDFSIKIQILTDDCRKIDIFS